MTTILAFPPELWDCILDGMQASNVLHLLMTGDRLLTAKVAPSVTKLSQMSWSGDKFPFSLFMMPNVRSISVQVNQIASCGLLDLQSRLLHAMKPSSTLEKLRLSFWDASSILIDTIAPISHRFPLLKVLELLETCSQSSKRVLDNLPPKLEKFVLSTSALQSRDGPWMGLGFLARLPSSLTYLEMNVDAMCSPEEEHQNVKFPPSLRTLKFNTLNYSFQLIDSLPPHLECLHLTLHHLVETRFQTSWFPKTLTEVKLRQRALGSRIVLVEDSPLPPNLTYFEVAPTRTPLTIDKLPPTLTHWDISTLDPFDITKICSALPNLRVLTDIYRSSEYEDASNFPTKLTRLSVPYAYFDSLAGIPSSIKDLTISQLFPDLPKALTRLDISGMHTSDTTPNITSKTMSYLPTTLTELILPVIADVRALEPLSRLENLKILDAISLPIDTLTLPENDVKRVLAPNEWLSSYSLRSLSAKFVDNSAQKISSLPVSFNTLSRWSEFSNLTSLNLNYELGINDGASLTNVIAALPRGILLLTLDSLPLNFQEDALSQLPPMLQSLRIVISSRRIQDSPAVGQNHFAGLPAKLVSLSLDLCQTKITQNIVQVLPKRILKLVIKLNSAMGGGVTLSQYEAAHRGILRPRTYEDRGR